MEAKSHIDNALAGLKDFQLATVNHTITEFYQNGKNKMLIADEVGLGKTIVARGIVAKMYERFLEKNGEVETFNVIYICSNQAIASQNIGKLNIINGKAGKDIVDYSRDDDRPSPCGSLPTNCRALSNCRHVHGLCLCRPVLCLLPLSNRTQKKIASRSFLSTGVHLR